MNRRTEHKVQAPPRGWTRREFLVRTLLSSVSAGSAGALANLLFVSRVMASEQRFSDYRALVNIYLGGGNDSLNMVFPRDASYTAYADTRQTMAWAQGSGRAITPATAQFFEPALAPALAQTASLFADGDLAILANVGVLTEPATRAQLLADPRLLPVQLFSHNDQQGHWFRGHTGTRDLTGWAGRTADLLMDADPDAVLPLNVSTWGIQQWQAGAATTGYSIGTDGATTLVHLADDPNLQLRTDTHRRIMELASSPLERQYAATFDRTRRLSVDVNAALDLTDTSSIPVPANNELAQQLSMIARLIEAQSRFGQSRQVFTAHLGGWDTHDRQMDLHPQNLAQLDEALGYFAERLKELNRFNDVTTFTMSEFGRTLTTNGDGTDHGWGGHQCVMGGAVAGGDIVGTLPALGIGSDDDLGDGRIIPTTSVEQMGSALLRWFGLTESEIGTVFPFADRFDPIVLFRR
jgi:uncharacterized protein (DUF1501 family)